MKITNVKVEMFNWKSEQWQTGVGTSFGQTRQLGIVTVETDEGISGNAFLGSSRMGADHYSLGTYRVLEAAHHGAQSAGHRRDMVGHVEDEPLGIHKCYRRDRHLLWDINGKIAGQPIHRLLGTCKETVPVYSSTAYWETKEEYVEEALRFQDMGWTAHKIHPHGNPMYDIEICKAVREAVGDDMKLMLDSMWAYQYEDAMRVGRAIEDLNFYWYEDPLVEEDIYNYVKLHQKLDIPIIVHRVRPWTLLRHDLMDNAVRHRHTARRCGGYGGITPMVRLCHLAEASHEVRDTSRRQLSQQCGEPAHHHGSPQLRVLRVLPLHGCKHVRAGRGHRHDRRRSPRAE